MKPNFDEMNRDDLRAYVLQHRDDMDAIRALFNRPSANRQVMPPMFDENGNEIEENIKFCEEAIRQRISGNQNNHRKTSSDEVKPDFTKMKPEELKAYVLEHRDDDEAIRAYFNRPGVKWTKVPPQFDEAGNPIEENIKIAEEMLRKRIEQERKKEHDRLNEDESHSE